MTRGQKLAHVLLSILIGVAASTLIVEVAANHLPLFQTDVRFVSEIMKEDPDIHRKFLANADVTYFSADMQRYNFKTHIIVDDYYGRDETPEGDVWAVTIGDSFTFCSEIPIEDC